MIRPGACHHARFMAKSIYLLEIYLLMEFPHSQREKCNVKRLAQFVALYGRYFLTSAISTDAPRNDLTFYCDLQEYIQVDQETFTKALESVRRHLWYLTPQLVVFCLLDDKVPTIEKGAVAYVILQTQQPQAFPPGKPGQPSFNPIARHLYSEMT